MVSLIVRGAKRPTMHELLHTYLLRYSIAKGILV
jgi:hypothetical protein